MRLPSNCLIWSQLGPESGGAFVLRGVHVDQRAAILDVVELRLVDPWMILRPMDRLDPDQTHDDPKRAHDEEDAAPAELMRDPTHQRGEQDGCEILSRVEEGGGGAALVPGKPGRHDAGVGGKGRRFGEADEESQCEQHEDRAAGAEETDPTLHHREQRPDDDAEGIDPP